MTSSTVMVEKKIYKSFDGIEFDNESDCSQYEAMQLFSKMSTDECNSSLEINDRNILRLAENYSNSLNGRNISFKSYKLFLIDIKNENDIKTAELLCHGYGGNSEAYWKKQFNINEKYLIYITNCLRDYRTYYEVYILHCDEFISYYDDILNNIKNMFKNNT